MSRHKPNDHCPCHDCHVWRRSGRPGPKHPACRTECQYAKDTGAGSEHSCKPDCRYVKLSPPCEDCDGTGHTDEWFPGHEFQPPEYADCETCGGTGRAQGL